MFISVAALHKSPLLILAWSSDGQKLAACDKKSIHLYSMTVSVFVQLCSTYVSTYLEDAYMKPYLHKANFKQSNFESAIYVIHVYLDVS